MIMNIIKGQLRHLAGAAGGGLVGFMVAQGYTLEDVSALLQHVETVAGLLLVFAASATSAIDKKKKENK